MTTGDPTPPAFNFDAIIEASGMIDPGVEAYMRRVDQCEHALNTSDELDVDEYDAILANLNENWPHHDVHALLSGRIRVFRDFIDSETYAVAVTRWGAPCDDKGGAYWDVSDADVVSRGIVDNGENETVQLGYAFSFEEAKAQNFVCYRGESIITFDRFTYDGCVSYLQAEWPELLEHVNRCIKEDEPDVSGLPDTLTAIAKKYCDELYGYHKLCQALSDYVTQRIGCNTTAAYRVDFFGEFEYRDDESVYILVAEQPLTEYVYRPQVVFSNKGEKASAHFVVSAGDGADDSEIMIIPARNVQVFASTYNANSIVERLGGDLVNGAREAEESI